MPKKLDSSPFPPPPITSRLVLWGRLIRQQRVYTKVTANEFCSRISISANTLRRMESGDSSVSIGSYLIALFALGILDMAIPIPDEGFVQSVLQRTSPKSNRSRARKSQQDGMMDNDYF